jgi:pSer/pThr/pTyr-binding forkhead associated (FHA) protein
MSATVTLTVTVGKLKGKDFTFARPGKRLIGRAEGCDVRFPSDWEHLNISRLHCLLDVDPPHARVWDVGSRNGTYVNGKRIGPGESPPGAKPEEGNVPGCSLEDGDQIRVGDVVIQVHIAPAEADTEHTEADVEASQPVLA